jgi:Rod binding domain-containing protein
MDNTIGNTRSYLDFEGLGQLKGQARQDSKAAMRETAQQFEAFFLQSMMKSMRDAIVKSDLSENPTLDTYQSMFDKEISVQMAKRNSVGLADMIVKSLEQQQASTVTTSEMLKMREEGALPSAKPIPLNPKETALPLNKEQSPTFKLPKSGAIPLNLMPMLGKNFDRSSL